MGGGELPVPKAAEDPELLCVSGRTLPQPLGDLPYCKLQLHRGGDRGSGPFFDPYENTEHYIQGTPKAILILTATHRSSGRTRVSAESSRAGSQRDGEGACGQAGRDQK